MSIHLVLAADLLGLRATVTFRGHGPDPGGGSGSLGGSRTSEKGIAHYIAGEAWAVLLANHSLLAY